MSFWNEPTEHFFRHLEVAGHSERTMLLYRCQIQWIISLAEHPRQVTTQMLTDFMYSRNWKATTRKSFRSTARTFFRYLHDYGFISMDPAARLPVIHSPQHQPRPTPEQLLQIALSQSSHRERTMLLLGGYAGLRCCEICKIHQQDWDRTERVLKVMGKGSKERLIPIAHPELIEVLDRTEGYLFEGRKDGHLSASYVCRLISQCLPDKWTAHTLRHRMATRAYAVSRDILVVGKLLGHSKPETTQGYVSVAFDELRRTVCGIE